MAGDDLMRYATVRDSDSQVISVVDSVLPPVPPVGSLVFPVGTNPDVVVGAYRTPEGVFQKNPISAETIRKKNIQAWLLARVAQAESDDARWGQLSNAQKDAANRTAVRAWAKLARLVLPSLEAE